MENILVNDPEIEKTVLSIFMQGNNAYFYSVEDDLDESIFYNEKNKRLYQAIKAVIASGASADVLTISTYLSEHRNDGDPEITEVMEVESLYLSSKALNLKRYVAILKDMRRRRELRFIGMRLEKVGVDMNENLEEAEAALQRAVETYGDNISDGVISFGDTLRDLAKQIRDNRVNGGAQGYKTGFKILDEKGGLHASDLVIVAGETSQGKTALTLSIIVNIAETGTPVIFYSMEMTAQQLSARISATRTGISSSDMLYKRLTEDQEQAFLSKSLQIKSLPIYFDDRSTTSIDKIISSIRVNVRQRGIKVAVIDYLQILGRNQRVNSTEQFYGDVTRSLKNLAKELDICIIALSQLSRNRENPEPTISRLRASGQIEEAADNIILIYRPSQYNRLYSGIYVNVNTENTAEIKIAKGRNIGLGSSIIGFSPELTFFYELDEIPKRKSEPEYNQMPF